MAGLFTIPRPTTFSAAARPSLTSRLIGFYTLILLIFLALLAFALQVPDPITKVDPVAFPGTNLSRPVRLSSSSVDCAGVFGRNGSGTASFPYYSDRKFGFGSEIRPKVCIASTTSAGLEQILPWIYYHKVIGISNFFLFVEGKAASLDAYKVLKSIPGVKLIRRTRDLEEQQANSRIWNESWLSSFFYKPCNYELFVKQTLNMETSIVMAREADMDWIIHLDTDELIYPAGNHEYSVQKLLSDVPEDVDLVIFPNYESTVERDDIKEPFSEVSMFKKNYDHLPKDTYFSNYREASRGNPNYFLTYGNGKSAARVQDDLRPNGAHRWNNYMKIPKEITFDEAAVLHYTYAKFSDLISRRDRCGCKLTNEDIERCFMLDFDRNAFVIASTGTEEQMLHWYRQYVVWTDKEVNLKLLKQGVLTRIYAPMVITQSLRESGVFSSVIASAQDTPSLEELQLSSGSSNTSQDAESITHSRKIGRVSDSRTNARKVLEYSSATSHAIPPQSPPEMHNIHRDR